MRIRGSMASRGAASRLVRWLLRTMSEIAVLMRRFSYSSVTSAIVRATRRRVLSSEGSSGELAGLLVDRATPGLHLAVPGGDQPTQR